MNEICVRCGRETEYDIHTPLTRRLYYIEGSGQLCEQCFSQLYPRAGSTPTTSPAPPLTSTTLNQGDKDEGEQIKTINLEKCRIPTLPDQDRYNSVISKPTLTDADREEGTDAGAHITHNPRPGHGVLHRGVQRAESYRRAEGRPKDKNPEAGTEEEIEITTNNNNNKKQWQKTLTSAN
mgnify:CR=1 FL=1